MTASSSGNAYKVAHMSGPTHNYLELAFSDVPVNDVEISVLRLKADEIKRLDENEVARQVKAGVEFACQRVAQKYYVKRIAFVSSDSPPENNYFALAQAIVERLHHKKEDF